MRHNAKNRGNYRFDFFVFSKKKQREHLARDLATKQH